MSYCRWSSDNFKSDAYVYKDINGGWTTWIAKRRYKDGINLPNNATLEDFDNAMEDITLPLAGECFNDPSPGSCADRLESLRAMGYHVPQYAIDSLRKEDN